MEFSLIGALILLCACWYRIRRIEKFLEDDRNSLKSRKRLREFWFNKSNSN